MNCLVIGRGPWGQNIAKTLTNLEHTVQCAGRAFDIDNRKYDAVFVATPAEIHAQITKELITRGIPAFVEKPFTTNLKDAEALEALWMLNKPLLLVDHTQLFRTDHRNLSAYAANVNHLHACGPGPHRKNCSGLWDWGAHAVAEAMRATGDLRPDLLSAYAANPVQEPLQEIVSIWAKFGPAEYLLTVGNAALERNVFWSPSDEPLKIAISSFLQCIQEPDQARGDARFGPALPVAVVRFLDAVDRRLLKHGHSRPQMQPPTLA